MAAPWEQVQSMTEEVQTQVTTIFEDLQTIASDAINKAYQDISADPISPLTVSAETDVTPIDLDSLMNLLDNLKDQLLGLPNYPDIDYTMPSVPSLNETPPTLQGVVFPDSPTLNLPTFDAVLEEEEVINPDVAFEHADIEYTSVLRDSLYSLLHDDLVNGDYGLNPNDEENLFNRSRDREIRAMQTEFENATRVFSSAGFTMPTGAAMKAIQAAQRDASEKISTINRELSIKKADLYANFKQFTATTANTLEKNLMDNHIAWMERLFKTAVQRVTSSIEIASFQLARLKWFMDKFKTLAEVYEIQVKAEGYKVDIYKSQVDAGKSMVEANVAIIEQFTALNNSIISIYKAKIDAYTSKIDAQVKQYTTLSSDFAARASAFAAIIGAYAKYYDIQSSDNTAVVQLALGEINAKVQAEKNRIDALLGNAQLVIEGKKAEAQVAATIGSAALSGLNVGASLSAGASAQQSGSGIVNYDGGDV